jgi:PqqA peptide cyclase
MTQNDKRPVGENNRNLKGKDELIKLDLNITNRCNYRCGHCAFASGEAAGYELSSDRWRDILEQTRSLGGKRIDITGGEPTIRPDLEDILQAAKHLGFKVELVTNGSCLTKERLGRLIGLGLDSLAVSIDGATYEAYALLRPVRREEYERVIGTIETAVASGLPFKINTVVHSQNLGEIAQITEQAVRWGAQEHGIYYFTPVGRGARTGLEPLEPLAWLSYVRHELVQREGSIKITLETPLLERSIVEKLRSPTKCVAIEGRNHLQILPDGSTYPCAIMASYNAPLGNVATESVRDVWHTERWQTYAARIAPLFKEGSCVDLGYDFKQYDLQRYAPICPLRKFQLEQVL